MAEVETTVKTHTYEGLFLLDAGQSIEAATEPIRKVLDRSEAEVLVCKPWDERKLAYEIKGRKRGLYVLVYFKLDPQKLADVENDVHLSDDILRAMFLRKDSLTEEEMNAETPATESASGPHESAPQDQDDQAKPRSRSEKDDDKDQDEDKGNDDKADEKSDDDDKSDANEDDEDTSDEKNED